MASEVESWEDLQDEDLQKIINTDKPEKPVTKPSPSHPNEHVSDKTTNVIPKDSYLRTVHPYFSAQPVVQILKKNPQSNQQNSHTTQPVEKIAPPVKSVREREKEYERARAQIFNSDRK
eukprot:TRINITY_DN17607_c0_g1_i1.p1 TRINITY_DN17607_c0_g1~~TRINITY_DN17607_c0_g1_i1.p1  ORF type:complete len:126 (-),score=26.81 TRINITY_DN17607_c0_g1_i1:52-408(-)